MELTGYSSIVRRWWMTLLAATMLGGAFGYAAALIIPPTFQAQTQLLVGPIDAPFTIQRAAGNLARTYADLVLSDSVLAPVLEQYPALDPERLEESIQTTSSEATRLVSISVQQEDPQLAAGVANAVTEQLLRLAGPSPEPEGQIIVVDQAEVPLEPVAPSVPVVVAVTGASGFVAALLLLVVVESVSGLIRQRDDVTRLIDVPILAVLERPDSRAVAEPRDADLSLLTGRLAPTAEVPRQRVAMIGTTPRDGSALVAAHLASELAAVGHPVALIDAADGAARGLIASWGTSTKRAAGPHRVTGGDHDTVRLRVGSEVELLSAFAAGAAPERQASQMLAALEDAPGVSVVHALLPASSAVALSWLHLAGQAVLVVTIDETRRDALAAAVEALDVLKVPLLGIVLLERRPMLGPLFRRRRRSAAPGEQERRGEPPALRRVDGEAGEPPQLRHPRAGVKP